jgi:TolB-like protein/Flp pilus assembly protein TadD
MATVYLARDTRYDRPVAIKAFDPGSSPALNAERFQREIRLAARLQHPHILTVLDSGDAGGLLWYAMPFVDGESLRQRLRRDSRLAVVEAVRLARQIADALDCAHRSGVIHRDVKPDNVLLTGEHAFIMDFGVARPAEPADGDMLTAAGLVVGTPAYMSPEQATGDLHLDGRSDIYSLGCILFEMLTGRPPFEGSTMLAVLNQRLFGPPPSVASERPEVPQGLDAVVRRAMATEPDDRYATAADLGAALADALAGVAPTVAVGRRETGRTPSIAVLPFANMSTDPENEFFTDGIAEEITSALAKVQGLRVVSRTSAFAFKGRQVDVGEIGRQLRVASVLEGSVRKAGTQLRIAAQLVDTANGYRLWSQRYDRELADVFSIQDEIAQNIAAALLVVLTEQDRRALRSMARTDVEAYEYYLRGRQLQHRTQRRTLEGAIGMYTRAMELDPSFAAAYAGIADCRSFMYMWFEASDANLAAADAASRRALELDAGSAEAHASRGLALSLRRDYDEAHREFETALRIAPKLFEAHYFAGRSAFAQGRFEAAAAHYQDAMRVRPDDFQTRSLLAMTYTALGRPDAALAAYADALQVIERHLELYPDDARALYFGASSLVALDQRERGLEWARRAVEIDPADAGIIYNVAGVYALAGDTEAALDYLERAAGLGMLHKDWLVHDGDFLELHGHPRFRALLERL